MKFMMVNTSQLNWCGCVAPLKIERTYGKMHVIASTVDAKPQTVANAVMVWSSLGRERPAH